MLGMRGSVLGVGGGTGSAMLAHWCVLCRSTHACCTLHAALALEHSRGGGNAVNFF